MAHIGHLPRMSARSQGEIEKMRHRRGGLDLYLCQQARELAQGDDHLVEHIVEAEVGREHSALLEAPNGLLHHILMLGCSSD